MSENIYGIHAVNSILANSPERLIEVFVLKGREDKRLQPPFLRAWIAADFLP